VPYRIEYYAFGDGDRQPAEEFDDGLEGRAPRLLGKLHRIAHLVAQTLPDTVSGGFLEKCRDYPDLYEIRTIYSNQLARYIVGKDGRAEPPRLVLLTGLLKRPGEVTPKADLDRAAVYWRDYMRRRRVSPEEMDEGAE